MKESKISSRTLLAVACTFVVVLVSSPLSYKFGFLSLIPSIISLMVGLVGCILVSFSSMMMLFIAIKCELYLDTKLLLLSLIISLLPLIFISPQVVKGYASPPIRDVSTDTHNPPTFDTLSSRQTDADNDFSQGTYAVSEEERVEMQRKSYPDLKTLVSSLDFESALSRSDMLLRRHGLEIIAVDEDKGIIEATDTTFWFGFKDDVVVRLSQHSIGTKVDIRSVSRIGIRDFGKNASRIERFLSDF